MLRRVFADLDVQLVVVTHDLDLVDDFERVLVIDDGVITVDDVPGVALPAYREAMA